MSLAISNQEKIGRNVSLKGLPTKEGLHVHGVTEVGRRHTDSVSHKSAESAGRSAKPAIHLASGGTTEQVAEKLHRIAALGWRSGFGVAQRLWGGAALQRCGKYFALFAA